ncbi:MAG TPA: TonB-dependent receptor [Bryobacteraceae bacterium]|nr:TonB-dependent receptor [Bryobacteraceae bacterium]
MRTILSGVFSLLWIAAAAHGQGAGSSGTIIGTISDASNAVVPRVTITAADAARGTRYTAVSDSSGEYRLAGLPPAIYDVSTQVTGFAGQVQNGIVVNVGATAIVDFHLSVAAAAQQVEVSANAPVVDTVRGSQSNALNTQYIMDLPIDRRDYLTFALLAPGVSDSGRIADDADFRVRQTPQSGLSFYGSNGRGNNVTVDGGEANDDSGGVRLNVSQDAVQEFQINRSNYAAELGTASGASINIVTKSGTNQAHGGLFGFFRNDAMDARDHFAYSQALQPGSPFSLDAVGTPIKDSLNRQQFGGSLGGPIKRDKTFLFVAYEGLHSDSQAAVPLLTDSGIFAPTTGQQRILGAMAALGNAPVPCFGTAPPFVTLPAAACAGALSALLTINPNATPIPGVLSAGQIAQDRLIVNQFETEGGLFPFPIRQHQASARLDQSFGSKDQAFVRYSFAHQTETDPNVQALTAYSRGTSVLNWDSTAQASWFHLFSPVTQNEARVQWDWNQFNVTSNDPGGPGLDVQGYGFFGRNIFLPNFSTQRRYEFADNLSLIRGHHTIKLGAYELLRGDNSTSDTFFAGRFEFLSLPGGVVSPCLQAPAACGLPLSVPGAAISNLQAWSLGEPSFYEQGFGNPQYAFLRPLTAFYIQDAWQIGPNFTLNLGLRYDLDTQTGQLNTDKTNVAPRISIAWDPLGDHKTVIRAGYGLFYSPIYAQIDNVVHTLGNVNGTRQIANTLVSILGVPGNPGLNSGLIYQTLAAEGKIFCGTPPAGASACITPADLAQFGLRVSNSGNLPPGTVLFSAQPNYRNPYSQQTSFGIERQAGRSISISASFVYVHTERLPWAVDANLLPGAPVVTGTGANGLPTNGLPFQDWGAPQCQVAPPAPNPCFADPTRTILQNNVYSSIAQAVYLGGIFEVRKRFSEHLSLLGNYTFSKAIDDSTDFNSDYAAFDEADLKAERALSDFDQRHKLTVAGVLESPWRSRALRGFELSPILNYHSGHPFNLLAGADINGDNHFTNDRPPQAGRNTGLGPDYASLDLRLSRVFRLTEKANLQFMAESFNLTNRTNYASVNNVVGAAFAPPFNVQGSAQLSPSQPLGFTSDFPKREIQLGVRLSF